MHPDVTSGSGKKKDPISQCDCTAEFCRTVTLTSLSRWLSGKLAQLSFGFAQDYCASRYITEYIIITLTALFMTQGGDGYSWRVGKKETAVNANAVGKSRALRQKKGGGDWWGKEYVLRRQLNDGYKEED